jgi:TANFOR domain-containing protein
MYSHFKPAGILAFIFLLAGGMTIAQPYPVNIAIAVAPPYSTQFSDYSTPGKLLVSITNNTPTGAPVSIYLQVSVTSTGGIRIFSENDYKMPQPLVISPGMPYMVSADNLGKLFSTDHLIMEGIDREDVIYGNGLPEDDYQICIRAFHYETGEPLSAEEPQGCSGIFSIKDLEPPVILSPLCGDTLVPTTPQVLTLSWTLPLNAPLSTRYYLKMIEVLPGDTDPNDAMLMAGHPLFFEQTVTATSFLYGPAQPALIAGRHYAYTVTAVDPGGKTFFRNGGQSEVCSFVWGKQTDAGDSGTVIMPPADTTVAHLDVFVPYCSNVGLNDVKGFIVNKNIGWYKTPQPDNKTIQVNKTHHFYLRWEDKADVLAHSKDSAYLANLNAETGVQSGIIYLLQVFDAFTQEKVWEEQVWQYPYFEHEMEGLPFINKNSYTLFIQAFRGEKINGQIVYTQKSGENQKIAESDKCDFVYSKMKDDANLSAYAISGQLMYKFQDHPEKYPVNSSTAMLTRLLMVRDTVTGARLADGIAPPLAYKGDAPNSVKLNLAEDGSFQTTVYAQKNAGEIGIQTVTAIVNGMPKQFKGRVFEYFLLELKSPYYVNPKTRIELSTDSLALGEVVTNVYSYTLTVEVKKGYFKDLAKKTRMGNFEDLNPKNVNVSVWRMGGRPDGIPYYEGDMKTSDPRVQLYQIKQVAKGIMSTVIGQDGQARTVVVVDKLICNYLNGDAYKIDITQDTVINGVQKHYISDLWLTDIKYIPTAAQVPTGTNYKIKIKATILSPDPPVSTVTGQLVYRDPMDPKSVIRPAAHAKVSLLLTYLLQDEKGSQTILDPYHVKEEINLGVNGKNDAIGGTNTGQNQQELENDLKNPFSDGNTILATTYTDGEGKFVFRNFANLDSLGYRKANGTFGQGSGEFCNIASFSGKVLRTVRLVMTGPVGQYIFNPSDDIVIQPMDSVNVGVLTAFQKTYRLTVVPRSAPENAEVQPLSKVLKGSKIKVTQFGKIIGELYVDKETGCDFYGTLRHNRNVNWDDYQIEASTSDSVGENSFDTRTLSFPRGYNDWKRDTLYANNVARTKKPGSLNANAQIAYQNYEKEMLADIDRVYYRNETDFYFIREDYKPVSVSINMYLEPKNPIISGRVLDASNTMRSVESGSVILFEYLGDKLVSFMPRPVSEANQNGYFTFTGLSKSHTYKLLASAKGYKMLLAKQVTSPGDTITHQGSAGNMIPSGNYKLAPKAGQQIHFPQILLMPNGTITGWVYDENGKPVNAFVRTTRSILTKTSSHVKKVEGKILYGQYFELKVATYLADTLFIIPEDLTYFTEAIPLTALTDQESERNLGNITVKERRHRMQFHVISKGTDKPVEGVKIKILDYESTTNALGIANFNFKNASLKNFWFKVTPPKNSDFIEFSGELKNEETKLTIHTTLMLQTGYSITGTVTTGGQPVPSAEVWVKNGNDIRKVTANDQGGYILKGIKPQPGGIGKPLIAAVNCNAPADSIPLPPGAAGMHNLIGQEKEITLPSVPGTPQTLNFELQPFSQANLTRLHGFPVHVTKLYDQGNGTFKVSGTLDLSKSPTNFEVTDYGKTLAFENLIVKPDPASKDSTGLPYLEANPGQPDFALSLALLKVRLVGSPNKGVILPKVVSQTLYNYFVQLEGTGSNGFLRITKQGTLSGMLRSKARIVDNSFNFPGSYFNFPDDQFYFCEKVNNTYSGIITSFKSSADRAINVGYRQFYNSVRSYYFQDKNEKDLKFKFLQFSADSRTPSSYITTSGTIVLKPHAWTLNPLLKAYNIKDTISMELPEIGITADGINTGGSLVDKIEIRFEEWNIVARNCEVGPEVGGIKSATAEIQTGALTIPIREFTLRNDLIFLGKPDLKVLKLGGIWDMTLQNPETAQFGLDPKVGKDLKPHYKLCFVGDPAANVYGLPGFGTSLKFQAISLISNGEQIISFAPNCENMRFYHIADFKPVAIYSYSDSFSVDGMMDFNIPRIPDGLTYKLMFEKQGSGLKVTPVAQDITFDAPGYVKFESLPARNDKQSIGEGLLTLYGTVSEDPKLSPIRIKLTKSRNVSTNTYNIKVERDMAVGDQFIKFGDGADAGKFRVDSANMKVIGQDWDLLRLRLFADPTFAATGFGNAPLNLAVFGEIKTDPDIKNQKMEVSGASTPFGDFTMTFDWARKQMTGTLNIKKQDMGGVIFGGVAEICIGEPGFYFVAAGTANVPSYGPFSAGVLVGSYNNGQPGGVPESAQEAVTRFSVGKALPCAISEKTSFSGLFVTGRKSIPILCYDKSIDLVVAAATVYTDVGIEASAWAVFVGSPQIGISAMVYAIAELKLASITCTNLSAKAEGIIKAQVDIDLGTLQATLGACASINIYGLLEQKTPLLVGCGPTIFSLGSADEPLFSMKAELSSTINMKNPGSPSFSATLGTGSCTKPSCATSFK